MTNLPSDPTETPATPNLGSTGSSLGVPSSSAEPDPPESFDTFSQIDALAKKPFSQIIPSGALALPQLVLDKAKLSAAPSSAEPAPPMSDARKLWLIEFALKAHRFVEAEDFDDGNAAGEIAAHCSCGFICSPEGNEWVKDHRIAWERHVAAAILAAKPSYSVVMDAEKSSSVPVQEEAPTLTPELLDFYLDVIAGEKRPPRCHHHPQSDCSCIAPYIARLRAALPALLEASRRADELEKAVLQEIENRDRFEDQITEIYFNLGGENEWSNLHDLGVEAKELADRLISEKAQLEESFSLSIRERDSVKADRDAWRNAFNEAQGHMERWAPELDELRETVACLTAEQAQLQQERDDARLIGFSLVLEYKPDVLIGDVRAQAKAWLDKQLRDSRASALNAVEALPSESFPIYPKVVGEVGGSTPWKLDRNSVLRILRGL